MKQIVLTMLVVAMLVGCNRSLDSGDGQLGSPDSGESELPRGQTQSSLLGTWVTARNNRLTQAMQITKIDETTLFILRTNLTYGDDGQVSWAVAEIGSPIANEAIVRFYQREGSWRLTGPDEDGKALTMTSLVNDEVATWYTSIDDEPVSDIYAEWAGE